MSIKSGDLPGNVFTVLSEGEEGGSCRGFLCRALPDGGYDFLYPVRRAREERKKMKRTLTFLAALLLVLGLAACKQAVIPPAEAPEAAGITVTDHMGRTVALTAPAEKIVSLTPANTEILYALGAGDRLVGRDSYSLYPEEAADLPVVGDYTGPNVEAVIALEPDLVLVSNYLPEETVAQLEDAGIAVAGIEATLYEDIPASIEMVAALTGADAKPVLDAIAAAEQGVAERAAGAAQPTVYYVMSFGDYGNWTGGKLSFINTMIRKAGGVPVTDTVESESAWFEYSLEQLVAADPDILLFDSYAGDPAALAEAEGYKELSAVKEGRVYIVDADIISRPGPRIAQALTTIADLLHPKT
jgi:iron complex transport system substrate-binding protein